jgi:uroporphyrinogen-III synthase
MTTISVIPTNEEAIPFLTELLSNKKDWVEEVIVYEHIPNEKTLEAIREVENGDTFRHGTIKDFIKWAENV